jgi:organic hydroperoxide reductase OsmC/OhrA
MPDLLPHYYSTSLSQTSAPRAQLEAPLRPRLHSGLSPELDAGGADVGAGSPERMLLSSLGLCLLTTFSMFARHAGIEILACDAKIGGTVENTPEGLTFTSIVMGLDLTVDGNVELVEETLEDAKQYCVVLNSLRIPVVVEAQLRTLNEQANELTDDRANECANDRRSPSPRKASAHHHAS